MTVNVSSTYLVVSTFTNATVDEPALSGGLTNVLPQRVAIRMWVQPTVTKNLRRPLSEGVRSFLGAMQAIWVPDPPGPGWKTAEDAVTGLMKHWSAHLPAAVGQFGIPGSRSPMALIPIDAVGMTYLVQTRSYFTMTDNPLARIDLIAPDSL